MSYHENKIRGGGGTGGEGGRGRGEEPVLQLSLLFLAQGLGGSNKRAVKSQIYSWVGKDQSTKAMEKKIFTYKRWVYLISSVRKVFLREVEEVGVKYSCKLCLADLLYST